MVRRTTESADKGLEAARKSWAFAVRSDKVCAMSSGGRSQYEMESAQPRLGDIPPSWFVLA